MLNKKMKTFYYVLTSHSKIYEGQHFSSYEDAERSANTAIFHFGGTAEILKCVAVMSCDTVVTKCEE